MFRLTLKLGACECVAVMLESFLCFPLLHFNYSRAQLSARSSCFAGGVHGSPYPGQTSCECW